MQRALLWHRGLLPPSAEFPLLLQELKARFFSKNKITCFNLPLSFISHVYFVTYESLNEAVLLILTEMHLPGLWPDEVFFF